MDSTIMKGPSQTVEPDTSTSIELANMGAVSEKHGTQVDENDMDRMGKYPVLKRQFKFLSIFGYSVILGNTWEWALIGVTMALYNGGSAGGIWMFAIVCIGMFFVTLSFAEMVSMMPTSGAQYHWVSELAPRKYQKFLSYVVGWLCVTGWQVAMASTAYGVSQQIMGLISLNMPSYEIQGWHGTLFAIAVTSSSILWNTVLLGKLPLVEGVALVLHVFGFFAFIVVLWVMGPRGDTKEVWTKFEDPSGWGSNGVATMVSILGPVLALGVADSACHLAEEVKDAAWVSPRAMVSTAFVNYILGFIMTITAFSTLGDDPMSLLDSPTGQPWIQIMLNATGSKAAANVMTVAMCLLVLFCAINQVTSSSRQLWSFARDKGLPFSAWLGYVPPSYDIPVNAVMATLFSTSLLSCIIIGSSIAFNILISVCMVSLYFSYIIVIACMLRKRILGERLLPSRFDLGKAGIFINVAALCYLSVAIVFALFPAVPNPSLIDMNWSSLIFGCFIIISMVYYYFHGRHNYDGPVEYVKKMD